MEETKHNFTLSDTQLNNLLVTLADSLERTQEELKEGRACQFEVDDIIKLYLHFETPEQRANRNRILKYKYFAPVALERWEREHADQPTD